MLYLRSFLSVIITLIVFNNNIFAQLPNDLFGIADKYFLSLETSPVETQVLFEIDLNLNNKRIRTLEFIPSECKFYAVIDYLTKPTLIWLDHEGNSGVIGQLTLGGMPLPMCEALAYNSIDKQLYAGVSTNGNPDNNDYHSESIVQVDISTGACTFISNTHGDIDAMEFINESIYLSDTENERITISTVLFKNLPHSVFPKRIIRLNENIYVVDLAYAEERNVLYATTGHDLYQIDLSLPSLSLECLGTTHEKNEYNGGRMYGLANSFSITSDFTVLHSKNNIFTVEFKPLQASNDQVSYFWDFGDGVTSSGYHTTHSFSDIGVFEVCLTVEYQACLTTHCNDVLVYTSNEFKNNSYLNIFPNPSWQNIEIELHQIDETINTIAIYNAKGQLINLQTSLNKQNISLNVAELSNGIYFLMINKKYTRKFVKQ